MEARRYALLGRDGAAIRAEWRALRQARDEVLHALFVVRLSFFYVIFNPIHRAQAGHMDIVTAAGTVPFTFHKESNADACPLCAAVRFFKSPKVFFHTIINFLSLSRPAASRSLG
jgi:hypothetical protein